MTDEDCPHGVNNIITILNVKIKQFINDKEFVNDNNNYSHLVEKLKENIENEIRDTIRS